MGGCCDVPAPAADHRFRRILWVALAANAAMFLVEVVAGHIAGSLALQADALDFLGDSANYAISLLVLRMGFAARARAALAKGLAMAAFGVWVLVTALSRVLDAAVPDPQVMGATGVLALAVNVGVAVLLFRYRGGDANMRSVWLCSRNDAMANVAVLMAAMAVLVTGSGWPDLAVAAMIAALCLHSAVDVVGRARGELAAGPQADAREPVRVADAGD